MSLAKFRRRLRRIHRLLGGENVARRQVFEDVYEHGKWGREDNSVFYSGVGSRGEAARIYVDKMGALLKEHRSCLNRPITVIDLGCGDFSIGSELMRQLPDCSYVGCDIVPALIDHHKQRYATDLIDFCQLDIVSGKVPLGDVCLVRQVLQHLSNSDVQACLNGLKHQFIYVSEGQPEQRVGPPNPDKVASAQVRFDTRTGVGRGLELDQPPFGLQTLEMFRVFAPPHEIIVTEKLVHGSRLRF